MKCIGIIPARYASSRFPGKPLINLKGKSMIQRVYEGALKSKSLTEVIVATDDSRILEHVINFGGKAILTSESHQTGTDRCGEVLQTIEADVVLNIQGDEPLVDAQQLDALCSAFTDEKVEIATLGKSIDKNSTELADPNRIKIVTDLNSNALYFSRSAIPFQRHAEIDYPYLRHIGLYAFRSDTLLELVELKPTELEKIESLEQLRWLYYGYKIRVIQTGIETPNIDVPEDVEAVLKLL